MAQLWTIDELNRLLASARNMPGDVAGIPARLWWPAFVLTILDTAAGNRDLLTAEKTAYDHAHGRLTLGLLIYELHPLTIEALERIRRHEHAHLFPWPWDKPAGPHYMLYRRMKELLWAVDLPYHRTALFERLRNTARRRTDILKHVDPYAPVPLRPDKLHHPRKRDSERWQLGNITPHTGDPRPDVYLIEAAPSQRTALWFFEEYYRPRRIPNATRSSLQKHYFAIHQASYMKGCTLTLDQLTDDLVEQLMIWLAHTADGSPRDSSTVIGYTSALVAQWRYAWRKKFVTEPPRDIEYPKPLKRLPEAWSPEEVGRLIKATESAPGTIGNIPARVYWPALILVMYDTGLRINALASARMDDFDVQRGWLTIRAEDQKQKADQFFHLHPDTIAALQRMPARRSMLFPLPLSLQSMREHFRRLLIEAGLRATRRDLFHKLRRTSGTAVCAVAGETAAQHHLGHSSPRMTKAYIDPRLIKKPPVVLDMERPQWRVVSNEEGVG